MLLHLRPFDIRQGPIFANDLNRDVSFTHVVKESTAAELQVRSCFAV